MSDHDPDDQARIAFAQELGFFVWAWNDLHEGLGHLFSAIISDGALSDVALAAWHSHNNDRSQREMLKAAAWEALATRPDLRDEVKWLVDHLNGLADKRNNAIHASYATLYSDGKHTVIANSYYGNRRSRNLDGKDDLTPVFRQYRSETDAFNEYAGGLFQCVIDDTRPLPTRPRS